MTHASGPHSLSDFGLADMARLCGALRKLGVDASSMEETAMRVTRCLFERLVDASGAPACALVRLFKTHRFAALPADLQHYVRSINPAVAPWPHLRCLTLLGTAGTRPEWNSRSGSLGHRAIPLASEEAIVRAPMIHALLTQIGIDPVDLLGEPSDERLSQVPPTAFDVFHVPVALGSPLVPAQSEFVMREAVGSVLGFGGALPRGELFAVIAFTKVAVGAETAQLFKPFSYAVGIALADHLDRVFA